MIPYESHRILFSIGKFPIYSWGVMFVIAFLIAFFLIMRQAKKEKINSRHIYNIALIVLIGAIIGSRLFFILEHLSFFINNPLQIFDVASGGMASYGGIFLALFLGWLYIKKQKDINIGQILDLFAPYLVLALAIGRIGCFLNGCCYGYHTTLPWAISVDGLTRHPTQIYSLLYNLTIFFILVGFRKIKESKGKRTRFKLLIKKSGSLFLFFLLFYSLFRFFIDFLRVYENYFLGLALSQWILLALFIFSFVILLKKTKLS